MIEIELDVQEDRRKEWCSFYLDNHLLCNECYSKKIGICGPFHCITIGE